jgi:hypothetical protein
MVARKVSTSARRRLGKAVDRGYWSPGIGTMKQASRTGRVTPN